MKKVLFFAAFGLLTLASCKKDYTCTCGTGTFASTVNYTGLNKADAATTKDACVLVGCTWATK